MYATLDTHDIQNVSVSSAGPGVIRVTGDYISSSEANGALIIIYSLTNKTSIFYHIAESSTIKNLEALISDLPRDKYNVSVFVVEKNGAPFHRAAASPLSVSVPTGAKLGNLYCCLFKQLLIICDYR